MDGAKNFSQGVVSLGYDAAAVSIVLTAGHSARFPATPFNFVWWNFTDYPNPADDPNVEICRCTNISSETWTITRAQENTSASTKNAAGKTYRVIAGPTAKLVTDIQGELSVISVAVNVVSNALSAETVNRQSADAALSVRIDGVGGGGGSVTSQIFSALSARVNTNSAQMTSADGFLANGISIVSQALSVETVNRVAGDSALTTAINIVSNAVSALSAQVSSLTSTVNTLSNTRSTMAGGSINQVLKKNSNTDYDWSWQADATGGGGASVTSANLALEISNRISADNALSVRIDTVSNGVSIVSQALSVETVNRVAGDNALSVNINTVSNAVSIVSVAAAAADSHANTVSAAVVVVSNLVSTVASALSVRVDTVSQGLSVETAARIAAVNTVSNAASVISAALANEISVRSSLGSVVAANSAQMTSAGNAISNAVSIVSVAQAATSAAVTSVNQVVSVISQQVSVLSARVAGISAQMTSADNAISNAVSVVSQALSVETAARIAADNALSVNINTVSNAVSIVSQSLSSQAAALSVRINTVSNALSALVLDSVKDVSAPSPADQNVLMWNSAAAQWVASAVTAGAGSVTSTELSAVSAAAQSAINTVSNAVSVITNALKVAGKQYYASAFDAGSATGGKTLDWNNGNVQKLSLGGHASVSATNPQAGARYILEINTGAGGFSVAWPSSVAWLTPDGVAPIVPLSASKIAVAALQYNGTKYIGSYGDDGPAAAVGGVSVTSTELSAASAAANTHINAVSQAVSVITEALGVTSKQYYARAFDVGSAAASVVVNWNNGNVQKLSLTGNAIISTLNPQAGARYLMRINTGSGAFSVTWPTSPAVTWLTPNGAVPVVPLSASKDVMVALEYDGTAYFGAYADNGPGPAQVSVTSTELSVVQAAVNVISAGLGAMQMRVVASDNAITGSVVTAISGLSISLAAGGIYQVEGQILYNMSLVSTVGVGFGLSYPAMKKAAGDWEGEFGSVLNPNFVFNFSTFSANPTGQFAKAYFMESAGNAQTGVIVVSVVPRVSAGKTFRVKMNGMFDASAAGTLQAVCKQTVASLVILRGSFFRAYRIL